MGQESREHSASQTRETAGPVHEEPCLLFDHSFPLPTGISPSFQTLCRTFVSFVVRPFWLFSLQLIGRRTKNEENTGENLRAFVRRPCEALGKSCETLDKCACHASGVVGASVQRRVCLMQAGFALRGHCPVFRLFSACFQAFFCVCFGFRASDFGFSDIPAAPLYRNFGSSKSEILNSKQTGKSGKIKRTQGKTSVRLCVGAPVLRLVVSNYSRPAGGMLHLARALSRLPFVFLPVFKRFSAFVSDLELRISDFLTFRPLPCTGMSVAADAPVKILL